MTLVHAPITFGALSTLLWADLSRQPGRPAARSAVAPAAARALYQTLCNQSHVCSLLLLDRHPAAGRSCSARVCAGFKGHLVHRSGPNLPAPPARLAAMQDSEPRYTVGSTYSCSSPQSACFCSGGATTREAYILSTHSHLDVVSTS